MTRKTEIEEALARLPDVGADFRKMFLRLAGSQLESEAGPPIEIFDATELLDVNLKQPGYRKDLPAALFFGSDGAGGFYYVDVDGSVDGKPGAVLWGDRSAMTRDGSVPTAATVPAFVRAARAGKHHPMTRRPSIGDREVVDIAALLKARASDWEPSGPGVNVFFSDIVDKLNCHVTKELSALYKIADGLRLRGKVAGRDAVVVPSAQLTRADAKDGLPEQRVESRFDAGTFPAGFWIGEHDGRRLLCCSGLAHWRGLDADMIVAVGPGDAPHSGVVLGRLSKVLRSWLAPAADATS
jgi:hypothetical protein